MKETVGFIAIGQGGGNIGNLFEREGYNVLYVNTSKKDLETLTEAKHTYHIKDAEGSNHDRDLAKEMVVKDFDNILADIKEKMQCEFIFVIFTSGGGTGSGASPALVDYLINHSGKKVGIVTVLPAETESTRAYINTYECFEELENINGLCASFIIDNNRGDKFKLNRLFVDSFLSVLDIPNHIDVAGNIDHAEIKEMLSTRGAAVITKLDKSFNTMPKLISSLRDGCFVPVEKDRVIKYIGVSTSTTLDMDALCKEFGEPLDFFRGKNIDSTVCILSGLTYPYDVLKKFKERIDRDQPTVEKNIKTTKEKRLTAGVNFLANMPPESAPKTAETGATKEAFFAKYTKPKAAAPAGN